MTARQKECGYKIGRITTDYNLQDVVSNPAENWQSGTSVRRLTEALNKAVVGAELNKTNVRNVEFRRELKRAGINVEQLSSDLVSHQTVYRHLTQCVGVSNDDSQTPDERREKARNTVYALQQRTGLVTESTLDTLQSVGITDLGNVEVIVDLQVVCGDCGQTMDLKSALSEGCNCSAP